MGNQESISCANCNMGYGELAVFDVSHYSHVNDKCLCVWCYRGIEKKHMDVKLKYNQCELCKYTPNKNIEDRAIFNIHWYGKFGGCIMCENCIYDKEYRKRYT